MTLVARLSDDWQEMRQRLRDLFGGETGQEALRLPDEACAMMTEARRVVLQCRKALGNHRQARP